MPRKSPIRHKVRAHARSNAHVHKYERGKGKKLAEKRRVIARVMPKVPKFSFKVQVDGKSYDVDATTFVSALDSGLERSATTPQHVKITKEAK